MTPHELERYRSLVEHAPTMMWRAGRGARCVYVNGTWLSFTGRVLEQELGDGWTTSLHPDDRGRFLATYADHFERRRDFETEFRLRRFDHPDDLAGVLAARSGLEAGTPLLGLVNRYRCKDGSYRWLQWRSVSDVDRGLVYAVARDVTLEREAQRQRRELTESLTTTLNSIADGVIATDADARVTRMNPVAHTLTCRAWSSTRSSPANAHS